MGCFFPPYFTNDQCILKRIRWKEITKAEFLKIWILVMYVICYATRCNNKIWVIALVVTEKNIQQVI
jgi:hypothetical protein